MNLGSLAARRVESPAYVHGWWAHKRRRWQAHHSLFAGRYAYQALRQESIGQACHETFETRQAVADRFYNADWWIRWMHHGVHHEVRPIYTTSLPASSHLAAGLEVMDHPEVMAMFKLQKGEVGPISVESQYEPSMHTRRSGSSSSVARV
jgi:hypothetical protein